MGFRFPVRAAWVMLALLLGAVSGFAQEPAVVDPPLVVSPPLVIPPPLAIASGELRPGSANPAEPEHVGLPPVANNHEMLDKYVWTTLGVEGAIHAALTGALDQWRKNPPEWDASRAGYAKRWTSDYAESGIGDAAKYTVARIFHHDPSYTRCECTGFARRLHHAVDSPFMARRRDGTRVLSAASLAGFLAGHVVSASTWYPARHGARDGLKHAGVSLVTKIGMNVFKEFRPRRSK